MARSLKGASLATLLLAYGSTNVHAIRGFFRVANAVLVQEAADPIRAPGTRSGHSHTVTGGSGFGITVDYATLQASTCTTSPVAQDRSAYWTPMVYFHHKNGSFEALDAINQGQQIYYSYQADDEAFPPGLRMIAGNNFARTKETPLNARDGYVIYDCIGGKQFNYPGFPTEKCPDKVRANVYFPTCGWANKTLDSWDHQSHVAYRQPDGKCPSTHPIRYPELHYELYWSNTLDGLDWADAANPSQPFVLSNGDPTGYGFHGDFFNGWDDTLAKAMADCDGGGSSGEPSTCKHFKVQTGDQMTACRKKGLSPDLGNNENIYGVLPKLPGCNRITNTEAEARAAAAEKCSDTDAPPVAGGISSKSSSSLGQTTSTKPSSTASSGIVTSTRSSANATSSTRSSSSAAVSSSSTPSRTASNPSSPTSSTCNATKTVTSTVTVFRTRTPLHTRPRATHV